MIQIQVAQKFALYFIEKNGIFKRNQHIYLNKNVQTRVACVWSFPTELLGLPKTLSKLATVEVVKHEPYEDGHSNTAYKTKQLTLRKI